MSVLLILIHLLNQNNICTDNMSCSHDRLLLDGSRRANQMIRRNWKFKLGARDMDIGGFLLDISPNDGLFKYRLISGNSLAAGHNCFN